MVTFEGLNTYEAYKKAALGKANYTVLRLILPLTIFIFLIGLLLTLDGSEFGLFFLTFGIIYMPLVYLMLFIQMKKHRKTNKIFFEGVTKIEITDHIKVTNASPYGDQTMETAFSSIHMVLYTKGVFSFYLSDRSFVMGDLDNLIEGSKLELIEILKANNVKLKGIK